MMHPDKVKAIREIIGLCFVLVALFVSFYMGTQFRTADFYECYVTKQDRNSAIVFDGKCIETPEINETSMCSGYADKEYVGRKYDLDSTFSEWKPTTTQ